MNPTLHRIAASQGGLFTSEQARAAGHPEHEQQRRVVQGRWQRVLTGVYLDQSSPPRLDQRCRAVMFACGEDASISGRATLRLRGVEAADPISEITVLVPADSSYQRRLGIRYRRGTAETYVWRGIRSVTVSEAAVEVARFERMLVSVPIIDEVVRRRLAAVTELEDLVLRLPRGARGKRRAAEALLRSDGLAESRPESVLRLLVAGSDLPQLVAQFAIYDDSGAFVARVDFAYPELRIAIEYDGVAVHHDDINAFREDRRRQNRLVAAGWTVLRFTAADLREPHRVIGAIRMAVQRHAS